MKVKKVEDIKLYIESGILELYILGDVTHDEKLQVEEMALKHFHDLMRNVYRTKSRGGK